MKTMIITADGLEECEALMTYDLLVRADIPCELVGLSEQIISAHGLCFRPHKLIDGIDPHDYDCLILPGGMPGTRNLEEDARVQDLIDLFVKEDRYIAAICAAPSILIHKGLLDNRRFTCFPGFESGLTSCGEKAVRDGRFITGRGLGAVVEFAMTIIETLKDKESAETVCARIGY